ncbi:MAG: imidazolonepropionase-like amidohydrolase [Planctomycetota bacterium]|jgi:imidazolonepropionase-like amidohydrolase
MSCLNMTRRPFLLKALGLTLGLSVAPLGAAQDLVHKGAPQTSPILIRGATLHTVSGDVIEKGDLLFVDGKITGIGAGVSAEGAEVIDGTGKHVFPGFVAATSTVGLTEISAVDMSIDTSEAGSLNPEVYAAVAVNPDSWHIPVARRNGVLVAGVFPQGGRVPGRVSAMQMDGWTWEDMALDRHAGLSISWPFMGAVPRRFRRFGGGGGDATVEVEKIESLFAAAEAYLAAKAADATVKTDLRFEAMAPMLSGEKPVYISLTTRSQAESALTWAKGRGLKPVIVGGGDATTYVDLLKRDNVMVAVTGTFRMPRRRDVSYASTFELPGLLENAGVRWCMTTSDRDSSNLRNLPYEAAAAVPYGLSPEAALRSITLSAAEFLGVDHRVGSLDKGKDATLFIADGDPLELTTKIERAFIQGRESVLTDKQTALAAKYRAKYRQKGLTGK